jgi:hypothetical protein
MPRYSQAEGDYWDKFINPQAVGGAAGWHGNYFRDR